MAAGTEPLLSPSSEKAQCVVWQWVLYVNVFMACISFSIVMPSLYLYLADMGSSASFYALVVASYSVGEAVGSLALGALSNIAGTKSTLQLCALVSLCGSVSYGVADTIARQWDDGLVGPLVVLAARFLQGVGSGGQQAVEQSYLSIAAPPEQRTELTSKLATAATLGFIFGPAMGAAVTQTPFFALGSLRFSTCARPRLLMSPTLHGASAAVARLTRGLCRACGSTDTKQGWVVAVLNVTMFFSTSLIFVRTLPHMATSPQHQHKLACLLPHWT